MRLREYETIFIIRPDAGEDEINQILERIKGVISSQKGTILREQYWGKKKLAYEVKKHLKGHYYYFLYIGAAGIVEEFERILKLLEAVIKFQTVKLGDFVDLDKRVQDLKDEENAEIERKEKEAAEAAEKAEAEEKEKAAKLEAAKAEAAKKEKSESKEETASEPEEKAAEPEQKADVETEEKTAKKEDSE